MILIFLSGTFCEGRSCRSCDGGAVKILLPTPQTRLMEHEGGAGAVNLGDDSCCSDDSPTLPETDDGGMREGPELSFLVLEVLCWFSGLTLQTDDGGMRKGIINDFYTFCYLEYFVRAGLVVHGDRGAVLGHRPYSQMDDAGIRQVRREMIKE
ncbi:hypothetical protein TNCV_1203251 [Trichonephila clavipes]|nr:hypothetical protein TNCV_1203251 [Trichonephila clavipes]